MQTIIHCDRCGKPEKARRVRVPREMSLCWNCFDAWRKWYLGNAYQYAVPIEELRREPNVKEKSPDIF